jgi:putative ABC transport system permease protein
VDEGAYLQEADLGKLKTIFWRHNILGFTPFLDVPVEVGVNGPAAPGVMKTRIENESTLIGTWYDHDVPIPDGTTFKTGLRVTHPSWTIQGRWFADGAKECVVGTNLAARQPEMFGIGKEVFVTAKSAESEGMWLVVTGVVTSGDAEDNAIVAPLSIAQEISNHSGDFRQLFVSALTKPADALAERDPKSLTPAEYDRWFCSPYISSITYQIKGVLPGTDVRAIRKVADSEGKILSHVSTLLWIVTLAALIAAALAVAATSATTVIERRGEIGIMKAIGATNATVVGLFLAEQLMLAIVGGAIGFVFGAVLARALGTTVFGTPAAPRVVLLPVALGIAALVAVIGSLIPLRRAARFDPAPILRGE